MRARSRARREEIHCLILISARAHAGNEFVVSRLGSEEEKVSEESGAEAWLAYESTEKEANLRITKREKRDRKNIRLISY